MDWHRDGARALPCHRLSRGCLAAPLPVEGGAGYSAPKLRWRKYPAGWRRCGGRLGSAPLSFPTSEEGEGHAQAGEVRSVRARGCPRGMS